MVEQSLTWSGVYALPKIDPADAMLLIPCSTLSCVWLTNGEADDLLNQAEMPKEPPGLAVAGVPGDK